MPPLTRPNGRSPTIEEVCDMAQWWAVWDNLGFPHAAESETAEEAWRLALPEIERQGVKPAGPRQVSPVVPEKRVEDAGLRDVWLEDGTYLRAVGDGSAHDDAGNRWWDVGVGIGEPDAEGEYSTYRSLGWARR